MRWFWGLIVVAVVVTLVVVAGGPRQPKPVTPPATVPPPVALPAVTAAEAVAPADPPAARAAETPIVRAPEPEAGVIAPAPFPAPEPAEPAGPPVPADEPAAGGPADAVTGREMPPGLDSVLGLETAGAGEFVGPPVPPEAPSAATPAAAAAPPDAEPAKKAKLVPQADGSVLVDDQYVVKGTGTEADPFIITWEMLVSTQDTYQPRLGRKVIPDRVKMISGKWVKISGYIAFPIMASSQDEMLMMLNQWDGCCIGVPPTPYDAIEVKLKKGVEGEDRLRVTGGVKGILRADPYLIKDWLVSLYLMDDGELIADPGAERREPMRHEGGVPPPGGPPPVSP